MEVFSNDDDAFAGFEKDPAALQATFNALRDPKPFTRRLAAEMLAKMDSPLAIPELVKSLFDEDTSFGATKYKDGKTIEIDVLGVSNGTNNRVVIAEIKSHLRETAIEQIQQQLNDYLYFAPEHKDKELLGLIACISAAPNIIQQALKAGLIVLIVNDNLLEYYSTNKQYTIKDYNVYDEL